MKTISKVILVGFVCFFAIPAFAQRANDDCFRNWYSLFRERGANPLFPMEPTKLFYH